MATRSEDTVRRRDIVLRYLGQQKGWTSNDKIEVDTLVKTRSLESVLNWMEDHEMIHSKDVGGGEAYRLSGFGREIFNLRMAAVGAVTAI